jgi:LacI family transcriptional regulator
MKDIALATGLNVSTVSRALDPSKRHLVRVETAALIRRTAEQLGYRVDRVAGALRRGTTGTVGVIVADLANPFIAPIIHGIARSLVPHNILAMVLETDDGTARVEACLDHLLSRRADAIVVTASRFADRPALEDAARDAPVVLAARGIPSSTLPQVLHDDRGGGELAARHLAELGHTRVTELRGPGDVSNFMHRTEGFRHECAAQGVEVVELPEEADRPTAADGKRLARLLLERHGHDLPTAAFAHNDLMALGALSVFRESAVDCPGQVSLVGYNDSMGMEHLNPSLTSLVYPGLAIGEAAGELAVQLVGDRGDGDGGALLPAKLQVRDSTAPPRSAGAPTTTASG